MKQLLAVLLASVLINVCSGGLECELPLVPPDNGSFERLNGEGSAVNTIAVFSCNEGYELIGSAVIFCKKVSRRNAQWSDSFPTCQIVDCGIPTTTTEFLSISHTTTTFGSQATFFCPECGRSVDDGDPITCLATGDWSCTSARCKKEAVWNPKEINRCRDRPEGGQTLTLQAVETLANCRSYCINERKFECKSVEWDSINKVCTLQDFNDADTGVEINDCSADYSGDPVYYREIECQV